jgi:hypothetical protein
MVSLSTANSPFVYAGVAVVLLALLLVGIGYAWLVRRLRRRARNHGYTAFLVVVGNLLVAVGYAVLAGLEAAVLLVLCMAAAGAPMVVEYIDDHLAGLPPAGAESERRLDL